MQLERVRAILLTFMLCFAVSAVSAQQNFKIAKIEFEGLNRLSADEMILTTGLKPGESFDLPALDVAAQKLVDSGLFKKVGYRTRANRDQITITFEVEETKGESSRVVFDNFIWFTDTELIAAVRREVPTFTGTAPDNGDMVERITKALQRFLHEHQIEAVVNYMASQDSPTSPVQEHVFSVTGVPMPICTLHFPGANNVSEAQLIESARPLIGNDYSSKYVSSFATSTLFSIYRERGQLKAAFSPPLAKPEATGTCKAGVELTLPVDEGFVYKWDKAEWSGINALNAAELDKVLGLQSGQIANGLKIDQAWKEVSKAYGRKGYLLARVHPTAEFNDEAQKVSYKISVAEGSQFRMGQLIIKGFSDDSAKMIRERWTLKQGDVFNDSYPIEFSQKPLGELMHGIFLDRRAQGKPDPNIKWDRAINRQSLTVDLTVELTN